MYAMCSFKVPITIFVHFEKKVEDNFCGLTEKIKIKGSAWQAGK
jgi:hypothetical protein